MKKIITILFLVCCSATNTIAQQSKYITRIPFELVGEHIFIKVKVNNSEDLNFLFDTGAGKTVINIQTAQKLKMTSNKQKITSGAAEKFTTDIIKNTSIKINNIKLDIRNLQSSPLEHLGKDIGIEIDGIIGYRLLKKHVVKINYDTYMLEICPSKKFKYNGEGEIVEFINKTSHPYINAQIIFDNGETLDGEFIFDTGAGGALALCTPFSEENNIIEKCKTSYAVNSVGYSKTTTTTNVVKISSFKISNLEFHDVSTNVYSVKSGFFSSERPDGLIGNSILKKYNITFDYQRKKTYWEPNNRFNNDNLKAPFQE